MKESMTFNTKRIIFISICLLICFFFFSRPALAQGLDQSVFSLKQKAVPLLDKNDDLLMQNRTLQKELLELRQNVDKLTKNLDELKGAPQEYQRLIRDKNGYQKELEKGIKNLEKGLSTAAKKYDRFKKRAEKTQEKEDKLRKRQEELISSAQDFDVKIQKGGIGDEAKLALLNEHVAELQKEIEDTLLENQPLQDNIDSSRELLAILQESIRDAEKKKKEAAVEFSETLSVYQMHTQDTNELKEENFFAKILIDQEKEKEFQKKYLVENQIQLLESDIEEQERQKELLVKEAQAVISEEMKPLRQENQEIAEEVQWIEEKVAQAYDQLLKMKRRLSGDKQALQDKNDFLTQEAQKLKENINELESQADLLKQKDRSLVRLLADSVLSYQKYNQQLDSAKTDLIAEKQLLLGEADVLGKKSLQFDDFVLIKQKEGIFTQEEIDERIREIKIEAGRIDQKKEAIIARAERKAQKQLEDAQFQNLSLTHQVLAAQVDIDKIKKEKETLENIMYHKGESDYSPKAMTGAALTPSPAFSNLPPPRQDLFKTPDILKDD